MFRVMLGQENSFGFLLRFHCLLSAGASFCRLKPFYKVVAFYILSLVFVSSAAAGEVDQLNAKKEVRDLNLRASDFIDLQKRKVLESKKKSGEERLEFVEKRKAYRKELEAARKKYVATKKKQKVTGDRGFSAYLKQEATEIRNRKKTHQSFLNSQEVVDRAKKEYRKKVPQPKEVDLSEDYF